MGTYLLTRVVCIVVYRWQTTKLSNFILKVYLYLSKNKEMRTM